MSDQPICTRCVLPHHPPDIVLDHEGVCNLCRAHEQDRSTRRPLEAELTRLLQRHRGKGEYDCLVMCSGGKDSTSALYHTVRRYRLRPLAFTFDHGFETGEALANVRRAVEILGVDFLLFRSTAMHEMFAEVLNTDSSAVLCHLCSIWYMDLAWKTAARYRIPLIIAGWTRGQVGKTRSRWARPAPAPEFRSMADATATFLDRLRDHPNYRDFPRSMEDVRRRAGRKRALVLSPHWFLPDSPEESVALLRQELGWKQPARNYPAGSTNCALNWVSSHRALRDFGYTHYHVEMSKLIREGQLTRAEALERLRFEVEPGELEEIARPLRERSGPAKPKG